MSKPGINYKWLITCSKDWAQTYHFVMLITAFLLSSMSKLNEYIFCILEIQSSTDSLNSLLGFYVFGESLFKDSIFSTQPGFAFGTAFVDILKYFNNQ